MARKSRRTRRLRVVNPDCAGIDIGKDRHFVAVDPERSDEPVRSFGVFTRDLEAMAAWLTSCGVLFGIAVCPAGSKRINIFPRRSASNPRA